MTATLKIILVTAALWLSAASAFPLHGEEPLIGTLQSRDISVAEIDPAHIKMVANLTVVPAQTVTLDNVQLRSLRLNGMPVFAEPLEGEIELHKDTPLDLPPMYVTVLMRDMHSVEPLRQMIEKQSVHVEGTLVADMKLNFAARLALRTQHPHAEVDLNQDVAVDIGGGPFARASALAILRIVQAGMNAGLRIGDDLDAKPAWVQEFSRQAKSSLFVVESSYSVERSGATYPIQLDQLGFRSGPAAVIATGEVNQPWMYDADFLSAMSAGDAKLVENSQQIELLPLDPQAAVLDRDHGAFSMKLRGKPAKDQIVVPGAVRARQKVFRRASPSVFTDFTIGAPSASNALKLAPASVLAQDSWDDAAVFRLHIDPRTKGRSVEILRLGASREGDHIHLAEPVDDSVFGSPIVTAQGVIGMVQDEHTGMFLTVDSR